MYSLIWPVLSWRFRQCIALLCLSLSLWCWWFKFPIIEYFHLGIDNRQGEIDNRTVTCQYGRLSDRQSRNRNRIDASDNRSTTMTTNVLVFHEDNNLCYMIENTIIFCVSDNTFITTSRQGFNAASFIYSTNTLSATVLPWMGISHPLRQVMDLTLAGPRDLGGEVLILITASDKKKNGIWRYRYIKKRWRKNIWFRVTGYMDKTGTGNLCAN